MSELSVTSHSAVEVLVFCDKFVPFLKCSFSCQRIKQFIVFLTLYNSKILSWNKQTKSPIRLKSAALHHLSTSSHHGRTVHAGLPARL